MSFREKSAWITLVTVFPCFAAYFWVLATGHVHGFESLFLLLICVIGLVVLQAALHIVAAALSPKEAKAPKDERETQIQWRAQSLGYYVLTVLTVALIVPIHFGHTALDMLNFALLNVVLATLTVSVAQIVMFRRGS
ncbi:MAG: hypothetical protein JSR98_07790 [Proteobacteria bacterium]|nr:hypothetical protein [Pseudomonadota bacterium]